MKSTFKLLSLFIILGLIITSCSKSDDVKPADIVGTWNISKREGTYKLPKETTPNTLSDSDLEDLEIFYADTFTFKSDKTFTTEDSDFFGTYTLSGNKLSMTVKVDNDEITMTKTVQLSRSNLIITTDLQSIIDLFQSFQKITVDKDDKDFISEIISSLNSMYSELTVKDTYMKK